MTPTLRGAIFGAVGMLVVLLLIGLLVVLTGGYNVAATERHTTIGAWALNTNFRNSVQGSADDIAAPEFTRAMVDAGAPEYKAMCAHCHGGVGEGRAEWVKGMRPMPPALARATEEWSAAEVYWLVKHGAKMTGMPAFGPTHDDEALWNIAAFVKAMPEMSAEQYAAYSSKHGGEEGGHVHGEGTPAHDD